MVKFSRTLFIMYFSGRCFSLWMKLIMYSHMGDRWIRYTNRPFSILAYSVCRKTHTEIRACKMANIKCPLHSVGHLGWENRKKYSFNCKKACKMGLCELERWSFPRGKNIQFLGRGCRMNSLETTERKNPAAFQVTHLPWWQSTFFSSTVTTSLSNHVFPRAASSTIVERTSATDPTLTAVLLNFPLTFLSSWCLSPSPPHRKCRTYLHLLNYLLPKGAHFRRDRDGHVFRTAILTAHTIESTRAILNVAVQIRLE